MQSGLRGNQVKSSDAQSEVSACRSVRDTRDAVVRYQTKLDALFVMMATRLPMISKVTAELLESSASMLDGRGDREMERVLGNSRLAIDKIRRELSATHKINAGILDATSKLVDAAHGIVKSVRVIGDFGWTLGVTGINASITAIRSGTEGMAFAALTRALTELAEASASEAKKLQQTGTELAKVAQSLAEQQREYGSEFTEILGVTGELLRGADESLLVSMRTASSALQQSISSARESLRSISGIMLTLQREDILRQELDHLVLVLESLAGERVADLDCPQLSRRFTDTVMRLSTELWSDTRNEVETLAREVLQSLQALDGAMMGLSTSGESLPDQLQTAVVDPMTRVGSVLNTVSRADSELLASGTQRLVLLSSSIGSSVRELEDHARQLTVLSVLVRIEVARTPALSGATTIAQQIQSAAAQLEELLVTASDACDSMKRLLEEVGAGVGQLGGRRSVHFELAHIASVQLNCLVETKKNAHLRFDGIRKRGVGLQRDIHPFVEDIRRFADGEVDALAVDRGLRESAAVMGRLVRQSPSDESETVSEYLQGLIERFTVISHKRLAGKIADVEVGGGGASGELTLF